MAQWLPWASSPGAWLGRIWLCTKPLLVEGTSNVIAELTNRPPFFAAIYPVMPEALSLMISSGGPIRGGGALQIVKRWPGLDCVFRSQKIAHAPTAPNPSFAATCHAFHTPVVNFSSPLAIFARTTRNLLSKTLRDAHHHPVYAGSC